MTPEMARIPPFGFESAAYRLNRSGVQFPMLNNKLEIDAVHFKETQSDCREGINAKCVVSDRANRLAKDKAS